MRIECEHAERLRGNVYRCRAGRHGGTPHAAVCRRCLGLPPEPEAEASQREPRPRACPHLHCGDCAGDYWQCLESEAVLERDAALECMDVNAGTPDWCPLNQSKED